MKTAKPFYDDSVSPALQAWALLKRFIAGQAFEHPRLFKRMSPLGDDVWELRTDDLRFFGWFPHKDCFIANSGDLFGNLKADKALYEKHRIAVIEFRTQIDLDAPKYAKGAKHHDVVS
ncbi:hypothetical protein RFM68_17550 [Mesorhizobium sp. MSK_1335]|uniref:Uncharacterized protein n=1 Tax=Mesorhizobium montanum TaxID=3072323 RepID=A0ABU4ZLR3_9HYPH|nr:hypothetical protein [Mesorhizobium sp. MSK_1335]MDX8526308.1 hypothetical protein [Mesorhizobium sp. MSK_1335]